jgi:hypothetical protein
MERKAGVQRTAEEKWQIVLEGLKSGNIAERPAGSMRLRRTGSLETAAKMNRSLI